MITSITTTAARTCYKILQQLTVEIYVPSGCIHKIVTLTRRGGLDYLVFELLLLLLLLVLLFCLLLLLFYFFFFFFLLLLFLFLLFFLLLLLFYFFFFFLFFFFFFLFLFFLVLVLVAVVVPVVVVVVFFLLKKSSVCVCVSGKVIPTVLFLGGSRIIACVVHAFGTARASTHVSRWGAHMGGPWNMASPQYSKAGGWMLMLDICQFDDHVFQMGW